MLDSLRPHDVTVHGIRQARILEWVVFPFSRDLPNPGIEPRSPTLQGGPVPAEPQGKPNTSKVMLKILQARLQQYVNCELPDVPAEFRKGRGTRDQIAKICWSWKKQESSRKTSISALLTMPKALTVWITINGGKF